MEGVAIGNTVYAQFAVAGNGSLAYVPGGADVGEARTLVWVDLDGREDALNAPTAPYESPRLSPDGRHVPVDVRDPENADVTLHDLQRETPTRLTFDPGFDGYPLWSPDGQRVLFSSGREGGGSNVDSKVADGTGEVEEVTTSDSVQFQMSWSADGQSFVVMDVAGGQVDLDVVSLGTENDIEGLIETEFFEVYGDISPDGRWIAYASKESGQTEVYVRPFPDVEDGRWQISRDGGSEPVWALDGRELFFRGGNRSNMMVVAVDTESTFSPGNPRSCSPRRIALRCRVGVGPGTSHQTDGS